MRSLSAMTMGALLIVSLGLSTPAAGIVVLWTAPNTTVQIDPPGQVEFENPLTGSETAVNEYPVINWRDADYNPGPPPPTLPRWDDWLVSDPTIDGAANEIWMRHAGQRVWTTSTVPGTLVSIHMGGDENDGLADVKVDGALVAQLDMGSSPGEHVFILVQDLANTTHTFEIEAMGDGAMGGDDVATLGAAVLGFHPQPYIVYDVGTDFAIPSVVDLEDQFITELGVLVEDRLYLMTPVEKDPVDPEGRTEEITDPDLHYRWFPLPLTPTGVRLVKVSNQFAFLQLWRIADLPQFLLAPASKSTGTPDPPPDTGHHYNCYEVVAAPSADAIVDLVDQFLARPNVPVGTARYLCAPVQKMSGEEVFETLQAFHGKDHLACYDIPEQGWAEPVNTEDQFGLSTVTSEIANMLCVPTRKTYPVHGVPSLAPWGMVALGLSMLLLVFWVAGRRIRSGETA